jgi:hypothetical protein
MAILDTKTVLARLGELGHNYDMAKQRYKTDIAGDQCVVYDYRGTAVTVKASDVEQYIAKGMTADNLEPAVEAEAEDEPTAHVPAGKGKRR